MFSIQIKTTAGARGGNIALQYCTGVLKLETQHELKLARQPRARIRALAVHCGIDEAEASGGTQIRTGTTIPTRKVSEIELSKITELHMVENIERLDSEFKSQALS